MPSPLIRQWNVLMALAGSEAGRAVDELAREQGVGPKTIRRDLVLLRRAGFPLEEALAPRGRKLWKIAGGTLPLSLNWQEAMSLELARRFLEPLAGTCFTRSAERGFAKVRAGLGPQALRSLDRMAGAVHLTNLGDGRYAEKSAILDELDRAIHECLVTQLSYQSERTTEPVTREVHPYSWVFHRNAAYVAAFATEHQSFRLYKVDRIHDIDVWKLKFPKRADFDPAEYLAGSFGVYRGTNGQVGPLKKRGLAPSGTAKTGQKMRPGEAPVPLFSTAPLFTIRVRFLPPVVQYVSERQWHASQTLSRERDGSLIAEFRLTATEEIKRWLLSFGRNAEVLEPPRLVAELREEVAAMTDLYSLEPLAPAPRRIPRARAKKRRRPA